MVWLLTVGRALPENGIVFSVPVPEFTQNTQLHLNVHHYDKTAAQLVEEELSAEVEGADEVEEIVAEIDDEVDGVLDAHSDAGDNAGGGGDAPAEAVAPNGGRRLHSSILAQSVN